MKIISVSQANCKNCYRCVRYCPVKAIKIMGDQAEVVDKLCLYCGRCVAECPQGAKRVRNDLDKVKELIRKGEKVIASIAPSYPALFNVSSPRDMFSLLRGLGFYGVEETAVGAEAVSREYCKLIEGGYNRPIITTACPVVKNLVEKYHPSLISSLAPVVSPMVAHGRLLKKRYGQHVKVVFIGPCIAKKGEAQDPSVAGDIDGVLTFQELKDWIEQKHDEAVGRNKRQLEAVLEPYQARIYPLPGGLLKTSGIPADILSKEVVIVDGIENCMECLQALEQGNIRSHIFEMMACRGGCIAGPSMASSGSLYERRQRLVEFVENNCHKYAAGIGEGELAGIDLSRTFEIKAFKMPQPGSREIRQVLDSIGKTTPEKELNCGACGYPSCRKKAEAVCQGMAEPDMCIPYMRSKAESLANLIIDHTPNGIILVDSNLNIREMNRSAERMFNADKERVKGKALSTVADDGDFAWVLANKTSIEGKKVSYPQYSLITLQTICYIEGQDLVLAIIQDVTEQERQKNELERVREETLEKAQEVINRQMRVAQEIAGLLGETTAESKMLLIRLMELVKNRGEEK